MPKTKKDESTSHIRYMMHAYKQGLSKSGGNKELAFKYAEALTLARARGMKLFKLVYEEVKTVLKSIDVSDSSLFFYHKFVNELLSKVQLRKVATVEQIIDKWDKLGLSRDMLEVCSDVIKRVSPVIEEKIGREGLPEGMFPVFGVTVKKEELTPHKETHEDEGTDEINVAGLSGQLNDPQQPKLHGSEHLPDGGDPISDDLAKESTQLEVLAELEQKLESIDFPADYPDSTTHSKLDSILTELEQKLESIDFPADYPDSATHGKLDILNALDFATETTLASIGGKDFSTETTLNDISLNKIATEIDSYEVEIGTSTADGETTGTLTFSSAVKFIKVYNLTATDDLQIQAGGGDWFRLLKAEKWISLFIPSTTTIKVKHSASAQSVEVLGLRW